MQVYSWNMLYRNAELDRAFEFVATSDFDVFCLQEVPEAFLTRLRTLSYMIVSRLESEKVTKSEIIPMYSVIITRTRIEGEGTLSLPDYFDTLPWRAKAFIRLMPDRFFARIQHRESLWIDTTIAGQSVRIINLHLPLLTPKHRLTEFETAMTHLAPSRATIVCGDFNILEKPHITPLNWLFGASLSDVFFFRRERKRIEQCFIAHGLVNPFRGSATQTLSQSQLDHILVSHTFSIKKIEVLPDRMGSDHHPLFAELGVS